MLPHSCLHDLAARILAIDALRLATLPYSGDSKSEFFVLSGSSASGSCNHPVGFVEHASNSGDFLYSRILHRPHL
jgi:hypothetical protein